MTQTVLTDKQKEILERLETQVRERKPEEGEDMPDKFSGPVGFDDDGKAFPLKPNQQPNTNQ